MNKFEVNQVLKLPTDIEYNAYPIEGVRQLALDNKPAGVKVFISQNTMKQNARELRNRDDGYSELPYLVDKLYLFTEGINEGNFLQINYTGNSGSYYKYGNDTIAQVDNIVNIERVRRIESIGNIEKIGGIDILEFLPMISKGDKLAINVTIKTKLGNLYNYPSSSMKMNGFNFIGLSISDPFDSNYSIYAHESGFGGIFLNKSYLSEKIRFSIKQIRDITISNNSWVYQTKTDNTADSATISIKIHNSYLSKTLYYYSPFNDGRYEYSLYDYNGTPANTGEQNNLNIISYTIKNDNDLFNMENYNKTANYEGYMANFDVNLFYQMLFPDTDNRIEININPSNKKFLDKDQTIEITLNGELKFL
ncbi:hypothetical protein BKH41_00715 [Helicobacter sp. 12S02232-10]|uniref:hypothetical protein n=1 Tax=Helicobacter sp. 12S02232-10 TaxID=1476197 RepID=UPI000BA6E53B|nr:hypothetical protein [Helicobacter sp. 12S02232-10]PAF49857.1 hypothetical protein BKH41_00715 [Helicobacter sp. 12S02232-10]